MFRRNISIKSANEIQDEMRRFNNELSNAKLSSNSAALLREQIETTLLQIERQLAQGPVRKINADRIFEGDDYQVTLRVRSGETGGFIASLKKRFGFG